MNKSINDIYQIAFDGDKTAENQLFELLSERFQLFLNYRIRNRQDIEDILQDCLIVVADKYKIEEKKDNFSGWAYQVLEYKLLSYYQKKKTKAEREISLEESNPVRSTEPDYQLVINLKDCLKEMKQSNTRYIEIINHYYQGYNADEITTALKINKNTMYILLSRARSLLKKCLKDKEELR